MKKMLVIFSIVLSQVSLASITDSKYDVRHQDILEKSIEENCGNFKKLTQIDSKKKIIEFDQGIRDVEFKTTLNGLKELDQGLLVEYEIVVESQYFDMYDQTSQNWGVYNIASFTCSMK